MSAPPVAPSAPAGAATPTVTAPTLAAPDEKSSGHAAPEWPLWEIFIRSQHGLAHKHVGSLHAPDAQLAIWNARDVYTRRNEGVSIWAVRSADVHASAPADRAALFGPASDKIYRHPTFFPMPEEVKHL